MVPKVTTSESSRACFEYDLRKKHADDPSGLWVAGTVFGTAREMAQQMSFFRKLRPDSKRPIISFSLSLPSTDGRPDPEKWRRITERFLEKMGVDIKTHAFAAHEHIHENPHIHIRLCRISSTGKLWNQENSAKRAIKVCAELEEEFNLEKHDRTPSTKKKPTMAEIQMSKKRNGKPMSREFIQQKVDLVLKNHPNGIDFSLFQGLLAVDQIDIQPYAPNGVLKGVSYLHDGLKWQGSKLGSAYSTGLSKRGVLYTSERITKPKEQEFLITKSQSASKMPAMLKPILLPAQYSTKQIKPYAAHQTEVTLDTDKFNTQVVNLQVGPAAKVMLLIGGLLVQASVFLIEKIIAFLKRLLQAFGFGMRQCDIQKHEHKNSEAPALCYEPTQLALTAPKSAEDKAADALFSVAEALEKNDSSLLPFVLGAEKERAAVQAAMDESGVNVGGTTTAETENFRFTCEDFVSTNAVAKPHQKDLLDELEVATAADEIASKAVEYAEVDRPGMYVYLDTREDRRADLSHVQRSLEKARQELEEWRASNRFHARFGFKSNNELYTTVEDLEAEEKVALRNLAEAEAANEKATKFYYSLPKGSVPAATMSAWTASREAVRTARDAIQSEALAMIESIKNSPYQTDYVSRILKENESQILKSWKNFEATKIVSKAAIKSLIGQLDELQRLKNMQKNAADAAMYDGDGSHHKLIIDGQSVK